MVVYNLDFNGGHVGSQHNILKPVLLARRRL